MRLESYITILTATLCMTFMNEGYAQQYSSSEISFKNVSVARDGSRLNISMDIDLSELQLSTNSVLSIIPEIVKGDSSIALEKIEIAGRKQFIYMQRNGANPLPLRYKKNKMQVIHYKQSIPFDNWMRNAQLSVTENNCGCVDNFLGSNTLNIAMINLPNEEFTPVFAFIQPKPEVKSQTGRLSLKINFPSGRSMLLPDFESNRQELNKINTFINDIKNNKLFSLKNVSFHGYASPEGSYALNERLANERVKAVAQYATTTLNLHSSSVTTSYTAEDWEGTKKFIEESSLSDKQALIDIINTDISPDNLEQRIKTQHAASYRYLLLNCFPLLRRTECIATYEIRDLTLSECRELFRTQPGMLNLNEFYRLAESYPEGSEEFNEVFDIAVRMFPDDPIANLNAANVALKKKQLTDAYKYIQKIPDNPESLNAKGVYAALNGNIKTALEFFEKAAKEGLNAAKLNLESIRLRLNTNNY